MNLKKAEPLSKFRVEKRTFCEGAVFYHRWMVVIDAKSLTDAQLKRALKDFGAHIAYLRRQKGWSQEELSFETGLARSYLSGIECGKRNPSLMTIVCLAMALGVSMSEVVGQRG